MTTPARRVSALVGETAFPVFDQRRCPAAVPQPVQERLHVHEPQMEHVVGRGKVPGPLQATADLQTDLPDHGDGRGRARFRVLAQRGALSTAPEQPPDDRSGVGWHVGQLGFRALANVDGMSALVA